MVDEKELINWSCFFKIVGLLVLKNSVGDVKVSRFVSNVVMVDVVEVEFCIFSFFIKVWIFRSLWRFKFVDDCFDVGFLSIL